MWIDTIIIEKRIDADYYKESCLLEFNKVVSINGKKTLGEVAKSTCNGPHGGVDYVDSKIGVRYIRAKNIADLTINDADPVYISQKDHRANIRAEVKKGDVLITITGANIGEVAVAPYSIESANIIQSIAKICLNPDIDAHFLVSYLACKTGKTLINREAVNTAREGLNFEYLKNIPVFIPKQNIQRAIGNKIRKAERLRELGDFFWSNALAKLSVALSTPLDASFFKQFDCRRINSTSYKCHSLSPAISWALSNDEIGAQYYHPRRINARDIAKRTGNYSKLNKLANPEKKIEQSHNFVGLDMIDSRTGVVSPFEPSAKLSKGPFFQKGDILFSRLRPYLNKVTIWTQEAAIGSGELLVFRVKKETNPFYVYLVLKSNIGLYQIIDVVSGSTHPRVEPEVVNDTIIPRLSPEEEDNIGNFVSSAFGFWYASRDIIPNAKQDVESLIDGTLDIDALLVEGAEIETWLAENPNPYATNPLKGDF